MKKQNLELVNTVISLFGITLPLTTIHDIIQDYKSVTIQNKLSKYFSSLDSMSMEEKESFKEKIESNENFKSNVVAVLIEIIDKTFSESNIDIIANLSHSLAKGKISADEFYRFCGLIRNYLYTDLIKLNKFSDGSTSPEGLLLMSGGFLYVSAYGGDSITFSLTYDGRQLLTYGINAKFD